MSLGGISTLFRRTCVVCRVFGSGECRAARQETDMKAMMKKGSGWPAGPKKGHAYGPKGGHAAAAKSAMHAAPNEGGRAEPGKGASWRRMAGQAKPR